MRGRGEPRIWGKGSSLDKRSGQKKRGFRGWFVDGRGWGLRIGERNETAGNTFVLLLTTPHRLRSLCFSHTCLRLFLQYFCTFTPPAGLVLYPLLRMPAPLSAGLTPYYRPRVRSHIPPLWAFLGHPLPTIAPVSLSCFSPRFLPRPDIVRTHRLIHFFSVSSI